MRHRCSRQSSGDDEKDDSYSFVRPDRWTIPLRRALAPPKLERAGCNLVQLRGPPRLDEVVWASARAKLVPVFAISVNQYAQATLLCPAALPRTPSSRAPLGQGRNGAT